MESDQNWNKPDQKLTKAALTENDLGPPD